MRWALISVGLCVLLNPKLGVGCSCGPPGPACSYISRAAAVFAGTVLFTDHDPKMGLTQRTLVKFRVDEAFKGLAPIEKEVWVDPGSFTSCYADYKVGEHLLVFADKGRRMPMDSSLMSIIAGVKGTKPLPEGFDGNKAPVVYSAPECTGTRLLGSNPRLSQDLPYLRQLRDGKAAPSIRGRVTEDEQFGIFTSDPPPGLMGVTVTAEGNGQKRNAKTDEAGFYVFEQVPLGKYILKPSLKPYTASGGKTRELEVTANACGVANFDMIAQGRLDGLLVDSRRQPAGHIQVEVLRLNAEARPIYYAARSAITDAAGHYFFTGLPSGDFQIGVNVFAGPDVKMPYPPTKWSSGGNSSIHLNPGETKSIPAFQLPARRAVRKIDAIVLWPDGRPAQGATVWAQFPDRGGGFGEVNANGLAQLEVLDGLTYTIEAKIWTESSGSHGVARSGPLKLTPGKEPLHLDLVLNHWSEGYR